MMDKLYHFTKFENALKIIEPKELWFSKLRRTNDGHETSKIIFSEVDFNLLDDIEKEIYKYQQLSLTEDSCHHKGFELLNMWGHYADSCKGICLVLDKKEIEKECVQNGIFSHKVYYDSDIYTEYTSQAKTIEQVKEEVDKNKKSIFYHKSCVWEHEQEFRLVKLGEECQTIKLDISKALKYIILFGDYAKNQKSFWGSTNVEIAKKVASDIPVLGYGYGLGYYSLSHKTYGDIWQSGGGYDYPKIGVNCEPDV